MKIYQTLLNIVLALILSSCGLLFNPSKEKVFFDSKPQGMSVLINDSLYGTTPLLASLSKKQDFDIKYKYLDSLVYTDSIKSKVYIGYMILDLFVPTNVYYLLPILIPYIVDGYTKSFNGLDRNIINYTANISEVLSDSIIQMSKNDILILKDEEAKREQAIRLETNKWVVYLNNGEIYKGNKLLAVDNEYLITTIGTLYDYDPNDFRKLIDHEPGKSYFPIDSIDKIVYADLMTGGEQILNTMLGLLIGAGAGLGSAYLINPHPKELGALFHVYITAAAGFIGGVWGYFYDSSDYIYYYFKNRNHGRKVDILKQLLLIK